MNQPPTSAPDRIRSLHSWTLETIGHHIATGALPPGHPINIDALAETYRLSRNSLREVVRILADKKMLTSRHGVGTRVQAPEQWNLLDADVLRWRAAAGIDEEIDRDIREFAKHALELSAALGGNVLYRQLMRNLGADEQQEQR